LLRLGVVTGAVFAEVALQRLIDDVVLRGDLGGRLAGDLPADLARSTSATVRPLSLSARAVVTPTMPPPMTATSTLISPASRGKSGAAAVAFQ
jgi:hypothetical protein